MWNGSSAAETTGSLRLRPRGRRRTLFSQRGHHHPHRQADQRLVARHGGRTHRHAPSSVCQGLIIWNTIFSRSSIINSSMIEFGKKETNMTVMIVIDRWRYLCGAVNTESVCLNTSIWENSGSIWLRIVLTLWPPCREWIQRNICLAVTRGFEKMCFHMLLNCNGVNDHTL